MQTQIGNELGVAAADGGSRILANISADGANTVTVDSIANISIGMLIDIANKTTGAVLASARTVDAITSAGVVTYSGADVAATPGTHVLVESGFDASTKTRSNVNGGFGAKVGLADRNLGNVARMRQRLKQISGSTYTDAYLDKMTYNDMAYAIRLADYPSTIK